MRVRNVYKISNICKIQYMQSGQAFLLVYDITRRSSFDELESYHDQILRVKNVDWAPMVLIGLNCELQSNLDRK
jgi:GTPase KRas protein